MLEPLGYALHRPTGGQVGAFQAGIPGAATPTVCGDYVQYLLPKDLAAGTPITSNDVGDPHGAPLAVTATGGQPEPVFFNPSFGPETNRSGSLGVFGSLGSGKSYFIKRLALATLARGGRVVTLDRTTTGEYTKLAAAVPPAVNSEIVEITPSASIGLDPLRVFDNDHRVGVALGVLTLLTRTSPTDVDGAAMAEAVRTVAAAEGGLGDVARILAGDEDLEVQNLSRRLGVFMGTPLARLIFEDRPPLNLDASYVCFHAPGLSLPDKDVIRQPHLAKQMLPEQLVGQALLYLVAAVARHLTFQDARFGATLMDEAWALTTSPQGRQLLLDAIRDGRKHNAAVWVLSQHPDDLGDDALSHLLGMRMLFRQSRGACDAALRFMGLDETSELIDTVSTQLATGQALFRDVQDRVGLITVLPAADPDQAAALDTRPQPAEEKGAA